MCASCTCFVLLGKDLYDGPIPTLEESYRLCVCACACVCVCVRLRKNKICSMVYTGI